MEENKTTEEKDEPTTVEISKIVEEFFIEIEDIAKRTGSVVSTFVKKIIKIKFDKLWKKESVQIKERIKKGLDDGKEN